ELLEDRCVPSTMSGITANFNGTAIPAGDSIWFSSALTVSGLPKTTTATVHVVNASIDFTASGNPYHLAVPDADIVFTPGATTASTTYDPSDNGWDTNAPSSGTGDVFMSGVALQLPTLLPGGIKGVTWNAGFWSDTPGLSIKWKWSAAVYVGLGTDYT